MSDVSGVGERPANPAVTAMLTDQYQLSMAYAYWRTSRFDDDAVFDLLFRKNPFKGEFTIFAGLDECLRYLNIFGFSKEDCDNLESRFPGWDKEFWTFLQTVDASKVKVVSVAEGSVVFPKEPLMRIEGPLGICQLLETTLLCLVNYPSLVATNAARHRIAAGDDKALLEFGLRRAQGPDGAMSASKYAFLGGFDGTSNVAAAVLNNIAVKGTHAHSFVSSYTSLGELKSRKMKKRDSDEEVDFIDLCNRHLDSLNGTSANKGELAAFIAYAQAFPNGFLALVDTYDTLTSGLLNFLAVSLALAELGYRPVGIRLDSGDLAFLSKQCREKFKKVSKEYNVEFSGLSIVASNDLNEDVLYSLRDQGHAIDSFGIGTHLVTCQAQPALGCVYKLVEIKGEPRIKVSQDLIKITIPGKKKLFRLFNAEDRPLVDLLILDGSKEPEAGQRILCRHPFNAQKRVYITPSRVEALQKVVWDGKRVAGPFSLLECKKFCAEKLKSMRQDHIRRLNPTPYKVSVSLELFTFMNDLWQSEVPIPELK